MLSFLTLLDRFSGINISEKKKVKEITKTKRRSLSDKDK
jgi:hypothetical protein